MRALLVVLPVVWLAIGCDRWGSPTCEEDWRLPVGAPAIAARAPNGSLGIVIGDIGRPVQFADLTISGAHLARVTDDGQVSAIAPITDLPGYPDTMLGDERGNFVVRYVEQQGDEPGSFGEATLVAYDPELRERWRKALGETSPFDVVPFDVAPGGEVLTITKEQNQPSRIEYVEPDGSTRWTAEGAISHVRIADNGDALVFGQDADYTMFARRHAASSGLPVGDRTIVRGRLLIPATDGGWFELGSVEGVASERVLGRFEGDGSLRWMQDLGSTFCCVNGLPALAEEGALVIQTYYAGSRTMVARFDDATGAMRQANACEPRMTLIGAGGSEYFGSGVASDGSIWLARFALP